MFQVVGDERDSNVVPGVEVPESGVSQRGQGKESGSLDGREVMSVEGVRWWRTSWGREGGDVGATP